MKLAGRLIDLVKKVPGATRFAQAGGKDIVKGSIPGALATSALATVASGGNPLAGLTVGAADMAVSSLMARGLGSRALSNKLGQIAAGSGKRAKLAGKIQTALPGKMVGGQYMMSLPQASATALGSLGASLTLEPYFYPKQEAAVLAQQYPQLSNVQVDQSQLVTQAQQLEQLKQQNNLGQQALSPGTMYQLQGMPLAVDPGIDPYNIMRGQL